MLLPATIDPNPGLGIVAAISLHAVFDALLLSRGLARCNGTNRQTDGANSYSRTDVVSTAATTATAALHLHHQ